ncbi:MAG: SDR family oxidoreductase [Anaerolineae bacterium]|jgi:NAD(P)-dependent dehydrogenase (short-subunit alcohol dehydrogenase family)
MTGKVCLVTGATSGLGQATAHALARLDATVAIVGRNLEKSAATVAQIKKLSGNPNVDFLLADLSSQAAIHQMAQQFKERYRRLDILINNAGAVFMQRRESVDGIEMTFALNHLGYFLLTNLLLDVLKASAPTRIVNTSSELHRKAHLDFGDLQNARRYRGMNAYHQSKLANVLFTYELARRLGGTGVTTNVLSPGLVATNLGMNNRGLSPLMKRLVDRMMGISPEEGARTGVYLASSPTVEGVTGKYFVKQEAIPSSPETYDEAIAARLWKVSAELSEL